MARLAVGDDARWPSAVPDNPPLGDLLAHGVDDLAKFQILALLCHEPTLSGDAAFFAGRLGLWSRERTEAVLAEMAIVGILRQEGDGSQGVYTLARMEGEDAPACTVFAAAGAEAWRRDAVSRLAARSLRRVRPRRGRRRTAKGVEA